MIRNNGHPKVSSCLMLMQLLAAIGSDMVDTKNIGEFPAIKPM